MVIRSRNVFRVPKEEEAGSNVAVIGMSNELDSVRVPCFLLSLSSVRKRYKVGLHLLTHREL